jgi:hypothetical protein
MKVPARTLGIGLALLGSTGARGGSTDGVDVLSHLQRERVARLGGGDAFSTSESALLSQLLVDPASTYSATVAEPAFVNDVDWPEILAGLPVPLSTAAAVGILDWDLGLTRARPGRDVEPGTGYKDPFVAASATKADVDADIFWHMVDLTGFLHSARAAPYAVAMQILREQIRGTAPERRAVLGIDEAVFQRVMKASHLDQVSHHDLQYLSVLVQYRLIHWQPGGRSTKGLRALPTVFRVARVAAAYRDAQGYIGGFPCKPDATPRENHAGTGTDGDERPLCFVAATDRAVHRWYVDEAARQAARVPQREITGMQRLAGFAAMVLALLDLAPLVEMVEAVVADDLVTAEWLTPAEADMAAERADRLFCPLPE